MEFAIGAFNLSKEEFLAKQGTLVSSSKGWSFSNGMLPVVLTGQYRSSFAIICHNKETFESLIRPGDTRTKKIYLVPIKTLVLVAGMKFIEFSLKQGWITKEEAEEAKRKEEENIKQLREMMFSGTPSPFGGLSNEDALVRACPKEFKENNPWSDYVSKLFFSGADISNWDWKTEDEKVAKKQMTILNSFLRSFGPSHQDKEAVAGWLLSEMLKSTPEYVAPNKK